MRGWGAGAGVALFSHRARVAYGAFCGSDFYVRTGRHRRLSISNVVLTRLQSEESKVQSEGVGGAGRDFRPSAIWHQSTCRSPAAGAGSST